MAIPLGLFVRLCMFVFVAYVLTTPSVPGLLPYFIYYLK